jgi:hypothetical protein
MDLSITIRRGKARLAESAAIILQTFLGVWRAFRGEGS